ncbi:N-acylneuraminate cytidylyltransferase [Paeniglutamicibacter cryotolerans]
MARAIGSALATPSVSDVVVSTDHPGIKAEALAHGAAVIDRPAEIAGDAASSESVLLHALHVSTRRPDLIVLLQCTSPFIDPAGLEAAIATVTAKRADVCFAVAPDHGFHWAPGPVGAIALGHDAAHRPRRQDRAPRFRETGAFYVMDVSGFLEHRHRFFGTLAMHEVPAATALDIDAEDDLLLARALADMAADRAPGHRAPALEVDALVTDFDGVHTHDTALLGQDGTESVSVSRSDGMGVARLRAAGIRQLILSTETNPVVAARGAKLRIPVLQGITDKATALRDWMAERALDPARVAYLGNDVNDIGAMALVGWPLAVADARPEARAAARHVLERNGGDGAVREAAELILSTRAAQTTQTTHPDSTPEAFAPGPLGRGNAS